MKKKIITKQNQERSNDVMNFELMNKPDTYHSMSLFIPKIIKENVSSIKYVKVFKN